MRIEWRHIGPSDLKATAGCAIVVCVDTMVHTGDDHPKRYLVASFTVSDDAIAYACKLEAAEGMAHIEYCVYDDAGAQLYPDD